MKHSNWNSCIDFERNEFVFENRNKLFGAYVIRREYSRNMVFAFVTACLFMGSLLAPFLITSLKSKPSPISETISEVITLQTFTPPPVEITPPAVMPTSPPSAISKELTNPVVVADKIATPDVQMTSGATSTTVLPAKGGEITSPISSGTLMPVIPDIISENSVKKWAEIMPKFQGGDGNLMTYLSSHIRYPSKALSNNIAGTVYVSFVVDTSGLVRNVQLIRGISQDCDQEAMKAMPKWQ
ncbi:MAG: TonB family protein [Bacteroidetes bacterium]|nr:TonB family protein [Bacteroidota bacterium]